MTETKTGDFAQNTLLRQNSGPSQRQPIQILANALAQIAPQSSEPSYRKPDLFPSNTDQVSRPQICISKKHKSFRLKVDKQNPHFNPCSASVPSNPSKILLRTLNQVPSRKRTHSRGNPSARPLRNKAGLIWLALKHST